MRWIRVVVVVSAVLAASCSIGGRSAKLPQVSTDCGEPSCVAVLPVVDGEGAPLAGATILIPFTEPVKLGPSNEVAVVNAVLNVETRAPEIAFAGVKAMRVDPKSPRQLVVEVDSFLADGSGIAFAQGVLLAKDGKPLPALELKLTTPWSPLTAALANVVWEPTDRSLFDVEAVQRPRGVTAEPAVRRELEERLRARGMFSDEQVAGVLGQFDSEQAKKKIPHARVRAGLLMLWGTSAEFAIQFVLADTNRRGVPFEPIIVRDLGGPAAAVGYHPLAGKLQMYVDSETALESLEAIAITLAHEALHSDLGGGSVTEEVLAMASDTRVWLEFLLTDPLLALTPTEFTRAQNRMVLAMRNSGRFGFPRAGVMARPGVDDVLRGVGKEPARSFREMLAKPHWYGDYNPKAGDVGTEVLEAYYARISGNAADQGKLKHDERTLKLYDIALDNGFTDEQIFKIADALRLKPIPIK